MGKKYEITVEDNRGMSTAELIAGIATGGLFWLLPKGPPFTATVKDEHGRERKGYGSTREEAIKNALKKF
jgi:hypothetical protein